ncbi:SDR family oxidoreductase [Actibacterium sp. 188UL27-1]|uniref:SDR family NAD(P)-dependent oxidoreductase n=1 Tax=Actibacterium sp. 188UL27-1 TaxID=2786961 RepID=UPI00195C2171|nr:SDR family oxidoreductase [Actibacterium sp. 188UL27-1]MBM7067863.1 SDR family oxidoreductase [Actibacterium sp. 188UL27-1]
MKTCLVTGASRGLGAALAESLTPSHHVIAVARTVGALEELDDRIRARGGEATLAPLDVTDAGAMSHLSRSIFDRWGGLDLWIHAAVHAPPLSPVPTVDQKDWTKTYKTNVEATLMMITNIAPVLAATSGARAVFFDDPRRGQKFFGAYAASKVAQMALVQSWQSETVKTGPTVTILQPAPMATATRARFFPGEDRSKLATPMDEAQRLLPQILS